MRHINLTEGNADVSWNVIQDAPEHLSGRFPEKVTQALINSKVLPPILQNEASLSHVQWVKEKVNSTAQQEFLRKRYLFQNLHLFSEL